jgi:hypothetical protein
MITDEIFTQLRIIHKDLTENEFAKTYLGTSRSYLCNRRNNGKDVSNDVALTLYATLTSKARQWRASAKLESDIRYHKRWGQLSELYFSLADRLSEMILTRAKNN